MKWRGVCAHVPECVVDQGVDDIEERDRGSNDDLRPRSAKSTRELLWGQPRGDDTLADTLVCLREALAALAEIGALDVDLRLALPLRE